MANGRLGAELVAARGLVDAGSGGALSAVLDATWDTGSREHHTGTVRLVCTVSDGVGEQTSELTIPNRGPEVVDYAVQFAAWTIVRRITEETV